MASGTPRPGIHHAPHRLAQNESPFGPSPEVLKAIELAGGEINRYPERFPTCLLTKISTAFGVAAERLVLGPGSAALLHRIVHVFAGQGQKVVYPWRSFEAYPGLIKSAGGLGVPVPLDHCWIDLEGLAREVDERTRLVIICNPNNPTGTVLSKADVVAFASAVPASTLVVVDEAYAEYETARVGVDGELLASTSNNVIILRTFSKAFALAGARVGFTVAAPAVSEHLSVQAIPFEVGDIAAAAVASALDRVTEIETQVGETIRERERMFHRLGQLGWPVVASRASYLWLPLGRESPAVAAAAAKDNLLVRCFERDGIRVTVGTRPANDAFLAFAAAHTPQISRSHGQETGEREFGDWNRL
jgi:histidinol-phosphate aminotransferase